MGKINSVFPKKTHIRKIAKTLGVVWKGFRFFQLSHFGQDRKQGKNPNFAQLAKVPLYLTKNLGFSFSSRFSKSNFLVILALHSVLYSLKIFRVFSVSTKPLFRTYQRSNRSLPFLLWYIALIFDAMSSSSWYVCRVAFPENHSLSTLCSFSMIGKIWKWSIVLISYFDLGCCAIDIFVFVYQFGRHVRKLSFGSAKPRI